MKTVEAHLGAGCSFSADGLLLASGSYDDTVRLWSREGKLIKTLTGDHVWAYCLAWRPDGQILALGSRDHHVRFWCPELGECTQQLEGHVDLVEALAWNSDGSRIASGSFDGGLRLWTPEGECVKTMEVPGGGSVSCLAWQPGNEGLLAFGSITMTVRVWNPQLGDSVTTLEGHGKPQTQNSGISWKLHPELSALTLYITKHKL